MCWVLYGDAHSAVGVPELKQRISTSAMWLGGALMPFICLAVVALRILQEWYVAPSQLS